MADKRPDTPALPQAGIRIDLAGHADLDAMTGLRD
jgi:hypothetical protein